MGTEFHATYRVGNGNAGNVGAGSIVHLVMRTGAGSSIAQVRNPLAAEGGHDPGEDHGCQTVRPAQVPIGTAGAILEQDYADQVMRAFGDQVQNARAYTHWEGTYWQVDVYVDPLSVVAEFEPLREAVAAHLQPLRRIWHRVSVNRGTLVPLDLRIIACVRTGRLQSHIRSDLMELFSSRDLGDGKRGLFHPDNLTSASPSTSAS